MNKKLFFSLMLKKKVMIKQKKRTRAATLSMCTKAQCLLIQNPSNPLWWGSKGGSAYVHTATTSIFPPLLEDQELVRKQMKVGYA